MRAAVVVVSCVAALASACSGGDDGAEPVAISACGGLVYDGEGEPDVIVVSDLPRRGEQAAAGEEIVDAIELVLRQRGFRAGEFRVGFQSCDDTVAGNPDAGRCKRNARAFVETDDVVGVIGPYISGCAELQIPIVSRTVAGPLAMISPSNTYSGLTRGPDALPLYPDGIRSYARVVTHDQAQAVAAAHLARRSGAQRAAVVAQRGVDDPYVEALTEPFRATARALGIESKEYDWRVQESYADLAASIAAARPDAVYLVGLPEGNAKTLIEDLRAELGQVPIITPDSFALVDAAEELGPIGDGLLTTVPGIPRSALPPAGKQFLREFGPTMDAPGAQGAPEAAQATEVLLDAIARSDGTRASVVEELFATKVENGILGSFTFDRFGDIDPAPVGVYRYENAKIVVDSVVRAQLAEGGG
ncbi:MAG TPA: ABC transporter substrate-binding protein [Gaiellaceae bacterium]|nr:ABC transporter substrate-binding protein [Gaiellaceae bacterium]